MAGRKPVLFTTRQAADCLEITTRHFQRLRAANPSIITPASCDGRSYFWRKSDVLALKTHLRNGVTKRTPATTTSDNRN